MDNIKLEKDERIDDLEYKNLKIIQKEYGFRFGMDSVLLSSFAKITKKDSIIFDLGTGTGIISILVAGKQSNVKKIYAIEIQEEMANMAKRSVKMNNLEDKIEVLNQDLKELDSKKYDKAADVIITNPPYKKLDTGLINEEEQKLISRHEYKCNLEDVIKVSSKLLKDNGTFYMVHRPERLVDISVLMRKYKIEPKEIRFVYSKIQDDSKLILIKGAKCGKPFLKTKKPLIIYDENGNYTDEIYDIYDKKRRE